MSPMRCIQSVCWLGLSLFTVNCLVAQDTLTSPAPKPNILWITSEDNGPQLGCYGDAFADTPNIDALALRGMRYLNCWSNAPVCAPARTTIISGIYPTSLGGQHMRSQVSLPPNTQLYPQFFHDLGYYCTNNSKEDYNLTVPDKLWDDSSNKAHWRKRGAGQPFFAVFNFTISHESKLRTRPHKAIHDPAKVNVPPYHPDTPEVRQDWAQYYDRVTEMDQEVGQVLQQLKDDGLADSTIVFYYGDHGSGMPRGKRWLYQSGLSVPLIVHVPPRFESLAGKQYTSGGTNERLVSFVDLMPTVLSLASLRPPAYLQGQAFLGKFATDNPATIFGFRDRMDERYDMSRAVRDNRYLYIRNFYPQRPQGAYLDYMFQTPTTKVWKEMFDAGKLNAAQSVFWQPKAPEELYDLQVDPYQIKNLADSQDHAGDLVRLRAAVKDWMISIADLGFLPEGQMLDLAGSEAPYTLGHDSSRYAIEEIYAVADLATRPQPDDLKELQEYQVSSNPTIRYWVASGLLLRAMRDQQRDASVKAARGMTTDSSPFVRCLASETMARFGNPTDRSIAIEELLTLADARRSSTFVALSALNSLDWCEPTRAEIGARLPSIPEKTAGLSSRYSSYIPDILKRIESIAK